MIIINTSLPYTRKSRVWRGRDVRSNGNHKRKYVWWLPSNNVSILLLFHRILILVYQSVWVWGPCGRLSGQVWLLQWNGDLEDWKRIKYYIWIGIKLSITDEKKIHRQTLVTRINEWMNGWIVVNEWIVFNERMNKWVNEWMDGSMK